ncbi:MAG: COX15/CtaA family protein [Acidimicrobiales bacterium]
MSLPRLRPGAYRRVTLLAALALAFIVVTGAAVRLTGSGLGCSDWPACEPGRLTPTSATDGHAMVEFANRAITGLVSLAVVLAVLGSFVRQPRRRDLVWLSLGLVAGVVGQIVLGGLTVLFELSPPLVMGHFLLSMLILWDAVVLHWRAGRPEGPTVPVVGPTAVRLGRLLVASAAVVVFTGTVVTAAGPHAGDARARRLDVFLPDAARVHGLSVVLLLCLTLAVVWVLRRDRAPAPVQRSARVLVGVIVAQAAIGYTQYFTGVPVLLVGAHILGAVAVWTAVIRLSLSFSAARTPATVPGPATAPEGALAPT